jgi:hypothetical protein
MKVCSNCKVEKELTEFYKHTQTKDGLFGRCKLCGYTYHKEYRLNNKKNLNEKRKIYRENNKEKQKEYYLKNKIKINDYTKKYFKDRKLIDSIFKLRCNISTLISLSIKKNNHKKNSKSSKILGCSIEEFKQHIEKQFTKGMTWANSGEWHLDHIYPVSLAKDEEELIRLNHYTNFQPLWAKENKQKSNKIIDNKQLKLI